jgi:hypothetical protein
MGRLTILVKRPFLRISSQMPETRTAQRMMGNVYFSVAQLAIPMKMFVDESPALEWLKELM